MFTVCLMQPVISNTDEPEPGRYMDSPNWLSDIEEYRAEPLRGEREAVSSTVESLLRSLHGRGGGGEMKERNFENREWQHQVRTTV